MDRRFVGISKFLSLVLRHRPEAIGVTLDDEGWVAVSTLLEACARAGRELSEADLDTVVSLNDKQRFVLRDGRIRASQGHSIAVDLGLAPMIPPVVLYHGTVEGALSAIFAGGLRKRRRQHVHLSADVTTATRVGRRRGTPVILRVAAARMHADGLLFYLSENGVWLTDAVAPQYLTRVGCQERVTRA